MKLGLFLLIPALYAGPCDSPFTAVIQPGSKLTIAARPANLDIRGTDTDALQVSCSLQDGSPASEINVTFRNGELKIIGGSGSRYNSVTIHVDLPQKTALTIRQTAGNLTVRDVTGDKEIDLRAGNIEILGSQPKEYSSVDLSARAGNIEAPKYGIQRSGLFRSETKSGLDGSYKLRAHVTTGNVTIR
jgi:DUF4097 and DUF4098 domain-containing protein YvlB